LCSFWLKSGLDKRQKMTAVGIAKIQLNLPVAWPAQPPRGTDPLQSRRWAWRWTLKVSGNTSWAFNLLGGRFVLIILKAISVPSLKPERFINGQFEPSQTAFKYAYVSKKGYVKHDYLMKRECVCSNSQNRGMLFSLKNRCFWTWMVDNYVTTKCLWRLNSFLHTSRKFTG
jgi:hypothetical protein